MSASGRQLPAGLQLLVEEPICSSDQEEFLGVRLPEVDLWLDAFDPKRT